jgi:hypothetical protein
VSRITSPLRQTAEGAAASRPPSRIGENQASEVSLSLVLKLESRPGLYRAGCVLDLDCHPVSRQGFGPRPHRVPGHTNDLAASIWTDWREARSIPSSSTASSSPSRKSNNSGAFVFFPFPVNSKRNSAGFALTNVMRRIENW